MLPQFQGSKEKIQGQADESDADEAVEVWRQVEVLVRILLMLTFDNLVYVQQYLPELFYIVLLLFSTGSSLARATVHGLLINIVHSLYTTMVTPDNKLQSLRLLLSELNQPKTRVLFGLGGQPISAFSKLEKDKPDTGSAPPAVSVLDISILRCGRTSQMFLFVADVYKYSGDCCKYFAFSA